MSIIRLAESTEDCFVVPFANDEIPDIPFIRVSQPVTNQLTIKTNKQ